MKTALAQLIENLIDKYGSDNEFINEAVTDAMLLQKAEKEQIMEAFNNGANWELYGSDITQDERAAKYYKEATKL